MTVVALSTRSSTTPAITAAGSSGVVRMPEKTIDGWLIVDWKQGTHRTRKSKPGARELGNHELLAKLTVNVTIPEIDVPELALQIDVPEPQVYAASLEALEGDELPDWTDVANEIIDAHDERIAGIDEDDWEMLDAIAKELTTETLVELKSRPDPGGVKHYIHRVCQQLAEPEQEGRVDA